MYVKPNKYYSNFDLQCDLILDRFRLLKNHSATLVHLLVYRSKNNLKFINMNLIVKKCKCIKTA